MFSAFCWTDQYYPALSDDSLLVLLAFDLPAALKDASKLW